jgi:hypothetical protein
LDAIGTIDGGIEFKNSALLFHGYDTLEIIFFAIPLKFPSWLKLFSEDNASLQQARRFILRNESAADADQKE